MSQAAVQLEAMTLNVLIVEDSEEDADLIIMELKRGGFNPHFRRVENAEGMLRALDQGPWDLVLSDFSMPHFTMTEALALAQQRGADLPFVIVSATIGEEAAVEAMKAGAHDYVLKHRLGRLVPAIRRELRESEMRRERRQLEDRLRRAQKLESLGLLAGGVAHDFNNLLTGILGNASLALDLTSPVVPVAEMLRDIIRASERAADLTRQLLAYAGKGNFVIEPVNISTLVREISELIRSSAPRNVALELELQPDVPPIEADATQMQQLVMNLILNAAEATSDRSGEVRVTTGLRTIAPGDPVAIYRPDPPAPGNYVTVQISDDGCGMTEAVQAQIFDPFFTTKFAGRGLGLSAALGIVRSHRGAISVESGEGAGSTFTVLLPALDEAALKPAEPVPAEDEPGVTAAGAILIVDDEDVVRRAARATLEHFGHTVFEASSGRDGADLFSRLHDRISAVLLDLTMPRMDGHDVWGYIRRIRPDMKIIISSGFEEQDAMKQFSEDPGLLFLKKPFTAAALGSKVREALERN
ncbi:MAG: response regulator [Bryobacteraceae bacterium]|jgi:two-component system, cell cycle sensor histidine kinase and response regulator CckA